MNLDGSDATLSPDESHLILSECDQFRSSCDAGTPLSITSLVNGTSEPVRGHLLRSLIRLDCDYRKGQGRSVAPADYATEFPDDRTLIESVFTEMESTVAADAKLVRMTHGYRLVEQIGAGVYGKVWRAEAPGGIQVAIKIVNWSSGDKLKEYELRALELMKRLKHPFLAQIHAYWLEANQLHIVMDLADETLADLLKQVRERGERGLPHDDLLKYFRECADALDYLHSEDVLHRDVKPENILLFNNHAKLGDFGLARLLEEDVRATTVGTPPFMAPEVWEGRMIFASDQYSLAATYVEMLQGAPLFSANSVLQLMRMHANEPPDLSGVPNSERGAVKKALSKRPEHRYPSCAAFVAALARQPSSFPWRMVAALFCCVFVVLLGGFAAWKMLGLGDAQPTLMAERKITVRAGDNSRLSIMLEQGGVLQREDLSIAWEPERSGDDWELTTSDGSVAIEFHPGLNAPPGRHA